MASSKLVTGKLMRGYKALLFHRDASEEETSLGNIFLPNILSLLK